MERLWCPRSSTDRRSPPWNLWLGSSSTGETYKVITLHHGLLRQDLLKNKVKSFLAWDLSGQVNQKKKKKPLTFQVNWVLPLKLLPTCIISEHKSGKSFTVYHASTTISSIIVPWHLQDRCCSETIFCKSLQEKQTNN